MRSRALALVLTIGATSVLAPLSARAAVTVVQVRSNYYSPQETHIAVGDTVSWTAFDAGHTVTADDLRFDFYPSRTLNQGETVSYTFTTDNETVYYHCRIHGPAMYGVIIVGNGSPPPPPPPPGPGEVRTVPSGYPTIGAALQGAPAGSEIDVAPGVYHETVTVSTDDVTIEGTGTDPSQVVLDGGARIPIGVRMTGAGETVQNLTVRRYEQAGISVEAARGWAVRSVVFDTNASYGLRATGARTGVIAGSTATTSQTAAFSISECDPCDTIVEGSVAEDSSIGLAALDASGIVVRDSTFRGNATGIELRSVAGGAEYPQQGAHIAGNLIEANDAATGRTPSDRMDLRTGAGIWVAGGSFDVIEGNEIRGQRYGVVVTSLGAPVQGDRVSSNVVEGDSQADLAWDGAGANVCFSGDRTSGGGDPTSEPPQIQTIYACDGGAPAGVPYPPVDADVLAYGLTH